MCFGFIQVEQYDPQEDNVMHVTWDKTFQQRSEFVVAAKDTCVQ